MKSIRLDVHGQKEIQHSVPQLETSSESVVSDLVFIVEYKGNVLIGIASALCNTIFPSFAGENAVEDSNIETGPRALSLLSLEKELGNATSKAARNSDSPIARKGTKMCIPIRREVGLGNRNRSR